MEPFHVLNRGQKYTKQDLANLLNEPGLTSVGEGVASWADSNSYLLFVDLEKEGKEERVHFNDFFEGDFFHWDSETTQDINTPKIQDIVLGNTVPHLFVRIKQKQKSKTLPFIYCGRLRYDSHDINTSKPVHLIYQNIDYDDFTENSDLLQIYRWKPSDAGMTTKSPDTKKGIVSKEREKNYIQPNKTEWRGLVTSRVGHGYYRQEVIQKWHGKCALTGIDILPVLIASHIVPWPESNDDEKLDVENGILLSPLFDALFAKHFIAFADDGSLLISSKISREDLDRLNLKDGVDLAMSEGMLPYIRRHRKQFRDLESESN